MSTIGVYSYYDDAGRRFQIALPSEFAVALGYENAISTDVYIPSGLSPRYATYVCSSVPIFRDVIITNKDQFVAPPQTVTADGYIWQLASLYGERFLSPHNATIQSIAYVQGPPGADATVTEYSFTMSADKALNVANNFLTCIDSGITAAGVYLALGTLLFQNGAAAGRYSAVIVGSSNSMLFGSSVYIPTASQYATVSISGFVTVPAGAANSIKLGAMSTITSGFSRQLEPSGFGVPAGRLTLIKFGG